MRSCDVLRVFTRGDVGGNRLGVVTDPTGLEGDDMQEIAAELGFSETVFIDAGDAPAVRIFTPALELPFAGHPLVGAAWTLGGVGEIACGIGEIPFSAGEDAASVDTPLVTDVRVAGDGEKIALAARLPAPQAAWWAMMPMPYLVLDLGSTTAVSQAVPDLAKLTSLRAGMVYLVGRQGDDLRVRFFAPEAGVPEDPATGSAAAAWAAVRAFEGEESGAVTIHQGEEIGHPSTIHLDWAPTRATLGGSVRRDEVRTLER